MSVVYVVTLLYYIRNNSIYSRIASDPNETASKPIRPTLFGADVEHIGGILNLEKSDVAAFRCV